MIIFLGDKKLGDNGVGDNGLGDSWLGDNGNRPLQKMLKNKNWHLTWVGPIWVIVILRAKFSWAFKNTRLGSLILSHLYPGP